MRRTEASRIPVVMALLEDREILKRLPGNQRKGGRTKGRVRTKKGKDDTELGQRKERKIGS